MRDGYLCQEAKRYGKSVPATTVHHIYPVETHPELKWEKWNLVSLSTENHNRMHERRSHKVTALGLEWQRRRRGDYERWCKRRGLTPHYEN